jgi:glucosyl-dolichyl phosphate glucuronosyltransferase
MRPEISVVISTYNRRDSLAAAIESILAQPEAPAFELAVVDNNCTDGTAALIHRYVHADPRVRYVFEAKQGVSHGRSAGIRAAQADIIAFTDDDVVVGSGWIREIKATFDRQPECGCIGGKVLPHWPSPAPDWLTPQHWAPLALLDYGEAQALGAGNPKCLITANMAVRREVFKQVGYFEPALQKTKDSTCSMEDREIQERYWRAGGSCWFNPVLVVHAQIQPARLSKDYHRRWHFNHGALHAVLRDPEMERSGTRILGIPGHILRRLVRESGQSVWDALRGCGPSSFDHEVQARFCAGFVRERLRQRL